MLAIPPQRPEKFRRDFILTLQKAGGQLRQWSRFLILYLQNPPSIPSTIQIGTLTNAKNIGDKIFVIENAPSTIQAESKHNSPPRASSRADRVGNLLAIGMSCGEYLCGAFGEVPANSETPATNQRAQNKSRMKASERYRFRVVPWWDKAPTFSYWLSSFERKNQKMKIKKFTLENPELDSYVEASRAVFEKYAREFAAVEYALDDEPGSFLEGFLQCFVEDYMTAVYSRGEVEALREAVGSLPSLGVGKHPKRKRKLQHLSPPFDPSRN